jgi:hypothetical protein
VVTFADARLIAVEHMEQHHPLDGGGLYAAGAEGAEDARYWLVEVGDSRYVVDGDPDYVLGGGPEVLVDKVTGEVTTLAYRDRPEMFAAMTAVPTMRATLPDGRTVAWSRTWPYLTGDNNLVAEVRAWLVTHKLVSVPPTGDFVEANVADRMAVFTAMCAVAPAAEWNGAPDLTINAPPDTKP